MHWSNIQNRERLLMMFLVTGLFIVMLVPEFAFAGTDGVEFDTIWNQIAGWIKGGLGRLLCGSMIMVGVAAGVVRQSLMWFGGGLACGLGLYNVPAIVKSLFSAAIPASSFGTQVLEMFSNGLN